jgi:hypothetical protein
VVTSSCTPAVTLSCDLAVTKASHCGNFYLFENHCLTLFTTTHSPFLFGFDGIYKLNANKDHYDIYVRGKNRGFTHVIILMKGVRPSQFYKPHRLVLVMDYSNNYQFTFGSQ